MMLDPKVVSTELKARDDEIARLMEQVALLRIENAELKIRLAIANNNKCYSQPYSSSFDEDGIEIIDDTKL